MSRQRKFTKSMNHGIYVEVRYGYCSTRHFVYIFFNPIFQLSTAKNEINLFNNRLVVAPVTFAPAGAMTPSAEFLLTYAMVWLFWSNVGLFNYDPDFSYFWKFWYRKYSTLTDIFTAKCDKTNSQFTAKQVTL